MFYLREFVFLHINSIKLDSEKYFLLWNSKPELCVIHSTIVIILINHKKMEKTMNTFRMAAIAIIFFAVTLISVNAQDYSTKVTTKDIVSTAVDAGMFKTLATALTEAGLIETLQGKGPFTVFAPTDDAFAKLPKGTVEGLLKDKEALKKILLYHVVSGNVMSTDVVKLSEATTVEGSKVKISVKDGNVMINDAKVIKADVKASNGVIHVIDTVILPPAK